MEGARERRERSERARDLGMEAPFLFFSLTWAHWSAVSHARVWPGSRFFLSLSWERAKARGFALECGSKTSRILIFLPFLISNAPQVMILHLLLMSPLTLLSINFKK